MPLRYVRPSRLTEAVGLLADADDDARPIAGGQSLIPMLNLGLAAPSLVVDVSGLDELKGVTFDDGALIIGAGVRHSELVTSDLVAAHAPMLAAAAAQIGSPRIRNVGTIGGSLAHADPAAELPLVCWVLDATVVVVGPGGEREVEAEEFSTGYYSTALDQSEVLVRIRVPNQAHLGWGFHEYARRVGDFALVASAASVSVVDGAIRVARVAVNGVADRPLRLSALETDLIGRRHDELPDIAALAESEVDPVDDPYVPASYRRRLTGALTHRALEDAVRRAEEVAA